jgi:hypothetical protein
MSAWSRVNYVRTGRAQFEETVEFVGHAYP